MVNPSVPTPIHVSAVPKSVQAGNNNNTAAVSYNVVFIRK